MQKTILVPTDFTVKSVGLVRSVLSKNEQKINLVLAQGITLDTSITNLLFLSKRKLLEPLVGNEFNAAIEMLTSKYSSQVGRIYIEIFTGNTISAFNNFLEGNKIDEAFISPDYIPRFKSKDSFDLVPFIKRSGIPVYKFPWADSNPIAQSTEYETVADLWPNLSK